MGKIRKVILPFLISFLCIFSSLSCFALPGYAVEQFESCATLDAGSSVAGNQQLLDTAHAAILYELGSDTMVYAWNPDQMLDPSGMNKIMTALLALEHGNLNDCVTVSNVALSSVEIGALTVGLVSGEEMTLQDLLYCMMVGSANDAAAVIAEHIAGGQAAFVEMMNKKAQELGCNNTVFMNPSGLSHESQHTTARDLAKITAAALEHETFQEFFCAAEYRVAATNKSQERHLVSTNYMISSETVKNFLDERVTGGKTGAFSTTDRSLICTAESGDARYLSVVMSAQGSKETTLSPYANFRETGALLDYGFNNYSLRRLLTKDQVLDRFDVIDGENDVAVSSASEVYMMMPNDMDEAEISYRCIKNGSGISAPVTVGQSVGAVQVWYGAMCVTQGDLIAMHGVNRPETNNLPINTEFVAKTNGDRGNAVLIAAITILVLILVAGCVLVIRRRRNGPNNKKDKRSH